MDRREALKKLAAGGAIAATGSMVLSTRDVAYAMSGGTGLTDIPGPDDPLPFVFQNNTNGTVTIQSAVTPSCAGSGSATTTYSWRILGYNVSGGNRNFFMRNAADTADLQAGPTPNTCSSCPMPYVGPTSTHNAVTLRKTNNGKPKQLKALDAGDYYEIGLLVTWQCPGAPHVEAEYRFWGTYPNNPDVEMLHYNVV
jgi:hypothetical protein